MAQNDQHHHNQQSPTGAVLIALGMIMFFCTVLWVAARRQIANIYGVLRSIEFPVIWKYVPGSGMFDHHALAEGYRPPLASIFINSTYFGFVFILLILVLMLLALIKLEKYSIRKHMRVGPAQGLSPQDVMEMYAETVPYVRFYHGYDLLGMSTIEGDARQPMRAMEVIEAAGALDGVDENYAAGKLPSLRIDADKMLSWYRARMGPTNPFLTDLEKPFLERAPEIRAAIAELPWTAVLILYPAIWRMHGFLVEDEDGFKTTEKAVNEFIASVWTELADLKNEYGDRLVLGFDNPEQRAIQNSLYQEKKAGGKKRKRPAKGKSAEAPPPDALITLSEVLGQRGEELKVVKTAYDGLTKLLICHLGRDTNLYPLRKGKDGCIEYGPTAKTASEQAFMTATRKKLDAAAAQIGRDTLFAHHYLYGLIGASLDNVRRTGVMPPHQFNWLRFYDKPLWYFVQNLGMPSAIPENGASYEHYRAERVAKTPISVPYIRTTLHGLQTEAEKYLNEDEIARIRETYGSQAIRAGVKEMDRIAPFERLLRDAGGSAGGLVRKPDVSASTRPIEPVDPFADEAGPNDQQEAPEAPENDPEEEMKRRAREGLGKFF